MAQSVTDAKGRVIELRRMGVLEQLRLYKVLGPELSENRAYIGLARIAAAVSSVDGVPLPFPGSEAGIEAALERLDEEGVAAVGEALLAAEPADLAAAAGN
ncbi:hypothetical protein [Acidocella facilis]|uniref:hypothetical protein n=1 Tax=Acidocella facilis TaxID=525 RepID=UPI000478980B|nr:hypothetical protein [Acidocella facilis]